MRPGELGRRPACRLITFVGIDSRREKVAQLARVFHQSAQEAPENLRAGFMARLPKKVFSGLPKAGMNMATAPRLGHGWLGHEGDCFALLGRHFPDALLEDHMHICHWDWFGINK